MKRKALIIGAYPSHEPLLGVSVDMKSWKEFLLSLCGGAWEINEIHELFNPSKQSLLKAVNNMYNVDYSIIAFSGHGYVQRDRLGIPITHLDINENETISELELNPGSPRCLMVLDCCRKFINMQEDFSLKGIVEDMEFAEDQNLRNRYRKYYENALAKCETGIIKLYAASLEQGARDENSFSNILLAISEHYMKDNKHRILSVRDSMILTKEYFKGNHPQQEPCYNGGRRLGHFPFALNLGEK